MAQYYKFKAPGLLFSSIYHQLDVFFTFEAYYYHWNDLTFVGSFWDNIIGLLSANAKSDYWVIWILGQPRIVGSLPDFLAGKHCKEDRFIITFVN